MTKEKRMSQKSKRVIVGGIAGFIGAGMGTVAGSSTTWINMVVGAIGAVVIVFLINGFIRD